MNKITSAFLIALAGLLLVGIVYVSMTPIAPPSEKITETVDDAHLAH